MNYIAEKANQLAESGLLPDTMVRRGIRRLIADRRNRIGNLTENDLDAFVDMMNASEVAPVPEIANKQHYEVPAAFFEQVLGKHRKYSCCYWGNHASSLDQAESAALAISCKRAELEDGMDVLELGCGWGSLSLWIATEYPKSNITSVSNSASQKEYIDHQANKLGISNLQVITADMNEFSTDRKFDRVMSIEMFEHMRNYGVLFERISNWLRKDGLFFMHIFCHRNAPYEFLDQGPSDWMTRFFFSGGIMPSKELPTHFQSHLRVVDQWHWSGLQYQLTAEAWLRNMDARKQLAYPIIEDVYGSQQARTWWERWRIFFLAVSEMFGSYGGDEWGVGHYLLRPGDKPELVEVTA